jgi:hypothetical protein
MLQACPWSLLIVAAITTGCDAFVDAQDWLGTRDPQPILHASLPQAVSHGGPVLSSPRVVPIFFTGDPFQSDVERFLSALSRSSYWRATTNEYGVGKLSIASSIVVDAATLPPTSNFTDMSPWLEAHLDSADPAWPAPSDRDLYVVFYPEAIVATAASSPSCTGSTYHFEGLTSAGTPSGADAGRGAPFAYAVVSECPDAAGGTLDDITWNLSYELIEGSTDPLVLTDRAFRWVEAGQLAWSMFTDTGVGFHGTAEVTHLCGLEAGPSAVSMRLDGEFLVPRSWSNAAAIEQQDPCVPATTDSYFGAAPDLTQTVSMQLSDGQYDTNGVRVPLHASRTVDVRLFSTKARPDFRVFAEEIPLTEGDSPTLKFAWDRQTGNDHEFLHLTITRIANGPLGGTQIRVAAGEKGNASWTHGWMGFIAN